MNIFLHVPKTAGTTLRSILVDVYGPDRILNGYQYPSLVSAAAYVNSLDETSRSNAEIFASHLEFGLHRHLSGNSQYITILRNPIDRVLSTYYFMKGGGGLEPHPALRGRSDITLVDFVRSGIVGEIDNGLVRIVSGHNTHARTGSITDVELDIAKQNLRTNFVAIGFTERFSESLVLISSKLGWDRTPLYRSENITPIRDSIDHIPEDAARAIEELCRLDVELYTYAMQLYEADISRLDGFQEEVERYERNMADLNNHLAIAADGRTRRR